MDEGMKKRLDRMFADAIWSQNVGESEKGEVCWRSAGVGDAFSWGEVFEQLDLKDHPENAKEVADYLIGQYQKMGEKILKDPSFVFHQDGSKENWDQFFSPEAVAVRAIDVMVHQMVEQEPSLQQNLQEYMEKQIKGQIENGNKTLEIGYVFAKEPFSPEIFAFNQKAYENNLFEYDYLRPHVFKAIVALSDVDVENMNDRFKGL